MNKGSFERNCELLLIHITNLQQRGSLNICKATTSFLAKAMHKSERQIYRYLKALEEKELIRRNSSLLLRDYKRNGKLFKLRTIKSFARRHEKTGLVMDIYFDQGLSKKEKKKMTQSVLSQSFNCVNISKGRELLRLKEGLKDSFMPKYTPVKIIDISYRKLPKEDFDDKIARMAPEVPNPLNPNNLTLEELRKICDEEDARIEAEKSGYDHDAEKRSKELLDTIPSHALPPGENSKIEQLAKYSIEEYKRITTLMEDLEPPPYEEKVERMAILASNTERKDGIYITRILLRGEIPYEVKLFDYVPWNTDSEYFRIFEEEFKKK